MSLTPFGRDRSEDLDTQRTTTAAGAGGAGGLTAFIDQGSEFEGKLSFRDTVRIDGRFRGEIASENTLIVGESGEIEATIRSNTISISGTVNGDVVAARKVVLHKTARVDGNISTPSLAIEEGAVINGQLKMGGGDAKDAKGAKAPGPLQAIQGGGTRPDAAKDAKPKT